MWAPTRLAPPVISTILPSKRDPAFDEIGPI
jgi:hypothetical protein